MQAEYECDRCRRWFKPKAGKTVVSTKKNIHLCEECTERLLG